jgi:hypothetical protein
MYHGKLVFAQIMEHWPVHEFQKCVTRHDGNYKTRGFSCHDQFLCMSFAQLTFRESLRDIELGLRSVPGKLYHLGFRGHIARSTLADANETRNWHIYADFAQVLIGIARLRIKAFYGHSENAVKTQIWIAVATYVLIAILKKRLGLDASLHEILQVLSLNLFEKTPILQACGEMIAQEKSAPFSTQMNLLDL